MARLFFLGGDEIKMEMSPAFLIFLMKMILLTLTFKQLGV